MIEAYIMNLGKYNEGKPCGEWLMLPATREEVQALFARIDLDGVMYEEIMITQYHSEIAGLSECLGEYESLDELNYLSELLEELDQDEMEKFEAAVSYGEDTRSVAELINLAQNLDCYDLYSGITNQEDLGQELIWDLVELEVPEYMQNYIDYRAYGRDYAINSGGRFTDHGFVVKQYGCAPVHYAGREDLPDEHKIFAYPKPEQSIKATLAKYNQQIAGRATTSPVHSAPSHNEGR